MNFKHLKYFVATADTGQVSRAAKLLSISQSAVTGSVRELETILGATLFVRRAKGMELTDAGREFLHSARDILEKLDAAQQLDQCNTDVHGTITLAATYTVIGYFLPYHLGRLAQLYPGIDIQIVELRPARRSNNNCWPRRSTWRWRLHQTSTTTGLKHRRS